MSTASVVGVLALAILSAVPGGAVVARGAVSRSDGTIALLDRYDRGEYEGVVLELARGGIAAVGRDLERLGPAWIEARGPAEVRRRRLVAATFALEAASLRFWPEEIDPLIEWGCQLFRKDVQPDESERLWQRASVAIFGRARDDGSLVTRAGAGAALGQRRPPAPRLVDHIRHARARFPEEARFRLAEAMLVSVSADSEPPRDVKWVATDDLLYGSDARLRRGRTMQAIQMFEALTGVPAVGAEAQLRSGYLWLTLHEPSTALEHFARARESADVFIAYLARLLSGRAWAMLAKPAEADQEYRSALMVIPHAQSASTALAADAFLAGRPDEAYAITDDMLSARPRTDDPWNLFGYGDLRFIPELMAQLREALK